MLYVSILLFVVVFWLSGCSVTIGSASFIQGEPEQKNKTDITETKPVTTTNQAELLPQ